jgi:protein-tyrosine kinase
MSLVEQTIARLKKQQAKDAVTPEPIDLSPHVHAPGVAVERLEDTASLAKHINVDNAVLRATGYFPEQRKDRQFADQYRRIKRPLIDKAMLEAATRIESRAIMVTSALPGDGKTFTSINLALSMALERDMAVLLIDADLAKRHVSAIFGLAEQPGLLDALVNEEMEPESAIVHTTTRGFSILPAGTPVAGTEELLSSNRMRRLMTNICTRNPRRIVLLDSPPLLVSNEGRALLKVAGQVVLVVRADMTPKGAIQAAIGLLDERQAGGVVLNQVQSKSAEQYYDYGTYGADEPT